MSIQTLKMDLIPQNVEIDFRISIGENRSFGLAPAPQLRSSEEPPLIEAAHAPRLALGFMAPQVSTAEPRLPVGRHRIPIPAISMGKGLVSKYQAQKIYGIRRDTGARKLKYLTRRHYEIIARHLSGQSNEQIHIYMGLSINTISRVLNDPLAQQVIKKAYKDRQAELDALAGQAIGAVRSALTEGSTSEKLAAVDKYTKLKQSIAPESNPMESAEDYARAIIAGTVNIQVNHGRQ